VKVTTIPMSFGIACLALALTGCGRSPKAPESQPKEVNAPPDSTFGEKPPSAAPTAESAPSNPVGVDWLLLKINGNAVPSAPLGGGARRGRGGAPAGATGPPSAPGGPPPRPPLDGATSEASGLATCNQFKGHFELDAAGLRFGPVATTRKACRGPSMEREQEYLKALQDTSRWAMTDDRLVLSDAAGHPLLEFAAQAGD
jgi:heat shock protein HslJ